MPEGSKENPKRKVDLYAPTVLSNNTLRIMTEIASGFEVSIKVLAKEGKPYTHKPGTPTLEYKGTVPKDKSYIQIESPRSNLADFWKAVDAKEATEKAAKRPPAKSPKA